MIKQRRLYLEVIRTMEDPTIEELLEKYDEEEVPESVSPVEIETYDETSPYYDSKDQQERETAFYDGALGAIETLKDDD